MEKFSTIMFRSSENEISIFVLLIAAPQEKNVSAMIRRRVSDGKVVVRKAAIQVSSFVSRL